MNGSSSFPQSNNEAASVDFQRSQPPSGAQLASTSTTTSAPMDMVPGGSMLMFGQNDAILDQLVQQAIAHQNSQHHQTPLSSFFSPAASESPTYYSTSSRRPSASPAGQANLSPLLSTPLDIAPQQPYATSTPLSTSLSPLLAGSLFPNSVRATPLNGSGFVGGPGSPMNTPSSANSSFGYAGISLFPFSSSYASPITASPPSANPFAHFGGDLSSFNPYTLGGGNATHGQGHAGPISSSYYYSPKPELSPTTATLGLSTPIVDAQIAPTYGPTSLPTTELDPSQIQSHLATTHTQSLEERIAQLSDPTQQEEVRAKLAEWTDASSSGPTLRTDENDEEIGEDWKTDEDVIPPPLDHTRQRLVVKLLCEWFERRQRPLNADLMQFARPRYGVPSSPLLPTAAYLDSSATNAGSSAIRPSSRVPAPTGYDCLWPGCTKTLKARTDRVQEEVLNHLNMKPHPCPHEGCGKVYLRGHDLKRHQNKDHSGGKSSRKKGEKEDARRSHAAPHLVGAVARLASTRQKRTRSLRGVEASNVLSSSVASPALTSGSSGLLQAEQSTSVPTVVDSNDALAPFPSLFPNRQDEPQQHQHHDQDFTDASLQDEARSHEDHIRRQQVCPPHKPCHCPSEHSSCGPSHCLHDQSLSPSRSEGSDMEVDHCLITRPDQSSLEAKAVS
ncbi:hypothetical protein FRC14_000982 [Serendipita sp. 396]|nr:hypothetical protein FRC14_000982 [Serendipita sp. 396]KAG8789002.1 hypothetical protein FRC15_000549 [Serendipita sp. 397]KAG8876674.1 hypothetical protein FRC20_001012 [Serendipita sp. 405]